jgi:hypothetical protein
VVSLLIRVAVVLAGLYLLVCLLFFFRQRSMLYFPTVSPESVLLGRAEGEGFVPWRDREGKLIGWRTKSGLGEMDIVLFHGNAGDAQGRRSLIQRLRQAGLQAPVNILEYPGFGARPGTPTQETLTAAAVDALRSFERPVVVFGESLGTGVAAQAAARVPEKVRGLILLTPFDSIVGAAAAHYPFLPVGLIVLDRFDSISALAGFNKPVAVIAGGRDETTPPEGARRLAASLGKTGRLWFVPEGDHGSTTWGLTDEEWRNVWAFVTSGGQGD